MRTSTLSKIALPAIAALLLLPISHAQSATQSDTSAAPALWKINCPGVPNVPMTSDAEQSMPLQIVAALKCGEEVTVLDNTEGYTARIKNADGQTGYVAAMYLKKLSAPKRTQRAKSAALANGVSRWEEGAPGCDQFMNNGRLVESLTVNGVTVQVSLHDSGWKLRANVAIANESPGSIGIDPSKFILDEVGAHGRPLFYQDPEELAKNVTHQVLWTETTAGPANVPSQSSSAVINATNIDYRASAVPTVSAPNYLVQHQSAEDDAVRKQGKQTLVNTAEQIRALALKSGAIEAGSKVSGAVWFERGKNPRQLMLRIPIENQMLEFPLSFKQ
ncbi:MAG: hypothetical protein JWO71_2963 [Candidatus Acidoferrum typicum]|nr:hypothetical protein [Candidatus Acidoferrum typicum]